jgi:hypothetical protein
MKRSILGLMVVVVFLTGTEAYGALNIAIVNADDAPPVTELMATGRFSSVTAIAAQYGTPTLSQLSAYDAILAYTNWSPADAVALGDVLADYVDLGRRLVLATYSFSNPTVVRGRIVTSGYSPLTNLGVNGNVSGGLVATVPGDPIFAGIDLGAVGYFSNGNFAHPGLDDGATLLATDGAGINMIARNASDSVVGMNLFPGESGIGNNAESYDLIANALFGGGSAPVVPEPSACIVWLLLGGLGIFIGRSRRNRE